MLLSFVIGQEYTSINPRMKSIIFPGLGEYSLGKKEMARNFFIREASLWIFFLGSKKTEDWYKRDYNALAELHADVNMDGKSYLFAVNIGHYNSLQNIMKLKKDNDCQIVDTVRVIFIGTGIVRFIGLNMIN